MTQVSWPPILASSKALLPNVSVTVLLAPSSSNSATTSTFPAAAAEQSAFLTPVLLSLS